MAQAEPSQNTGRDTGTNPAEGFGRFKNDLADHLDLPVIHKLSTLLGLKRGEIDIIERYRTPGYMMVNLLESRGVIAPTSITDLVNMLHQLNLGGLAESIQKSFQATKGQSLPLEELNFGKLDLGRKNRSRLVLESFSSANRQNIILENGDRLPVSSTLEELQIRTSKGKEFTQEQVIGLISYGTQCRRLKNLSFIDCLLPLSFPRGYLSSIVRSLSIEVQWKPSEPGLHLDCIRGKWISNSKKATTIETKGENSLRLLCSSVLYLRETDSKQLQMSTILLLKIASSHNIPISDLYLEWSFRGFKGKDIRLASGLSLPSLSSVEKISVNEGRQNQEFTEEEVIGLTNYGIKSPRFKKLCLDNCKLPASIKSDIIPEEARSRNIKVISSNEARYLDLISGQWRKPDDIHIITAMVSGVSIIHRDTSESVQSSVIELLVKASKHDIPICCVNLVWSFSKIDADGNIILSSGLSLPIVTSIEWMNIQTEKGREMSKHEVNGILNYVQHSQRCKKVTLQDCLLPSSTPVGPSLSTLKYRGVNVIWIPDHAKLDEQYNLDLDSGRWLKVGSLAEEIRKLLFLKTT